MSTEMIKKDTDELALQSGKPMGFEDEDAGDVIIPRVKVVQALSPERKDKVKVFTINNGERSESIATEGDIINSLTKEKLNGKTFVPVFKFNNNVGLYTNLVIILIAGRVVVCYGKGNGRLVEGVVVGALHNTLAIGCCTHYGSCNQTVITVISDC